MLICLLVTCLPFPGLAAENIQKISGKVYTFPDDNDYDIASATGYKMSNAGGKTYGTFTIHGDVGKPKLTTAFRPSRSMTVSPNSSIPTPTPC